MTVSLAIAAALLTPAAQAATPAPAATEAVDPARLAAAKRALEALMPPEKRAAMFDTMLGPMMANIQESVFSSPSIKDSLDRDPKVMAALQQFIGKQQERTGQLLRATLPDMFAAMERAYARRFTVDQLNEVAAFFTTPTGRFYMDQSMTIMSDPDVLAWQRGLMQQAMAHTEQDMKALQAEIAAEAGK